MLSDAEEAASLLDIHCKMNAKRFKLFENKAFQIVLMKVVFGWKLLFQTFNFQNASFQPQKLPRAFRHNEHNKLLLTFFSDKVNSDDE